MGLSLLPSATLAGDGPANGSAESQPGHAILSPTQHEQRLIEGWTVFVDTQLLSGTNAAPGRQALAVLAHKLWEIRMVVAESRLAKLQKVRIYLDAHHALERMQYHPSAQWLREHGYDPAMAKAVHVPRAKLLVSRHSINEQPWAMLHELAHAYHDQVLDFDEPRIQAAWEKFKTGGKFDDPVPHISGQPRRHYALTNQKEFFAEMTEAYFGANDFFPFVRPELKAELPEVFALLEDIWGPLPYP